MAFPTIESITTTANSTNEASTTFDLPATVNSGDLLLALVGNNGGDENITLSGWTQIDHQSASGGVFALDATGSEGGGTVSASWDSNEKVACAILRITGWSGTVSDIEADFVFGPNATTTMPTLTPSHGSDDYLWVIHRSSANSGNTVTTWPTSYTSNQTRVESTGGTSASHGVVDLATYENTASSESPGSWVFSANYGTANGCWLIAIRPAQGGAVTVTPDAVAASWGSTSVDLLFSLEQSPVSASWSANSVATGGTLAVNVDAVSSSWLSSSVQTEISVAASPLASSFATVSPAFALTASLDAVSASFSVSTVSALLPIELAVDAISSQWAIATVTATTIVPIEWLMMSSFTAEQSSLSMTNKQSTISSFRISVPVESQYSFSAGLQDD